MSDDIIRVLRILEYVGPRALVEAQVAKSIHGEKAFDLGQRAVVRAATIGVYPEIVIPSEAELYEKIGELQEEIRRLRMESDRD